MPKTFANVSNNQTLYGTQKLPRGEVSHMEILRNKVAPAKKEQDYLIQKLQYSEVAL